jgi:hypothetical protein
MTGGVDKVSTGAQSELQANVDMSSKLIGMVENNDV